MLLDQLFSFDFLVGANAVVYALMIAGVVRNRREQSLASDPQTAFALLERSLRSAFPDLPVGFTWREAVTNARELGVKADWDLVRSSLGEYEAWRYGGAQGEPKSVIEVSRLARAVAKRRGHWPVR
jgi:hypothetical protein